MTKTEYLTDYDEIVKTVRMYIYGSKQGKSDLMRPAFHPNASFFGYAGEQLAIGTQFLFDWIDKNGPAPKIEPRIVSVDILESIAVVRLEVAGWSGNLAGSCVRMSDLFTLLKMPSGWKIIQKVGAAQYCRDFTGLSVFAHEHLFSGSRDAGAQSCQL